jgi:hypothetical protein
MRWTDENLRAGFGGSCPRQARPDSTLRAAHPSTTSSTKGASPHSWPKRKLTTAACQRLATAVSHCGPRQCHLQNNLQAAAFDCRPAGRSHRGRGRRQEGRRWEEPPRSPSSGNTGVRLLCLFPTSLWIQKSMRVWKHGRMKIPDWAAYSKER